MTPGWTSAQCAHTICWARRGFQTSTACGAVQTAVEISEIPALAYRRARPCEGPVTLCAARDTVASPAHGDSGRAQRGARKLASPLRTNTEATAHGAQLPCAGTVARLATARGHTIPRAARATTPGAQPRRFAARVATSRSQYRVNCGPCGPGSAVVPREGGAAAQLGFSKQRRCVDAKQCDLATLETTAVGRYQTLRPYHTNAHHALVCTRSASGRDVPVHLGLRSRFITPPGVSDRVSRRPVRHMCLQQIGSSCKEELYCTAIDIISELPCTWDAGWTQSAHASSPSPSVPLHLRSGNMPFNRYLKAYRAPLKNTTGLSKGTRS